MKRFYSAFLLLALPAMLAAQTMIIHQGPVGITVNSSEAGVVQYLADGIQVDGFTIAYNTIDSITFAPGTVRNDSVLIAYTDSKAMVRIPLDVYKHTAVEVNGAHVSAISTQVDGAEVIYSLSGSSTNGSFYQDGQYKFTLNLNNLTLTSEQGAPINVANGKRIDIRLTGNNTFTDTNVAGATHKATFFINGHAEFKGDGTLNLTGLFNHAYRSDEYTILKKSFTGTINVLGAANDGMHIGQYFEMSNGNIQIENTASDGIQVSYTNSPDDEFNGQALLHSGTINVTCTGVDVSAFKCDSILKADGGNFTFKVTGNGSKAVSVQSAELTGENGGPTFTCTSEGTSSIVIDGDKKKCAGFKTKGDFVFMYGTLDATAVSGKALNVGGDMTYSVTDAHFPTALLSGVTGQVIRK